jgi:hypothetical protein
MGGFEDLTVEELVRPDPSAAAVYLLHSYGGGSSNQELVVLVFQCVDGRLRNTQLIHGDGHGWGAGVFFTKDRLGMTMLSVDDYSTGHCCPRFLETAKFRWAKNKYALRASAVRENHY